MNDSSEDETKPARPRRWFGLFEPATTPSTFTPEPAPEGAPPPRTVAPPAAPSKGWFGRLGSAAPVQPEPAPLAQETLREPEASPPPPIAEAPAPGEPVVEAPPEAIAAPPPAPEPAETLETVELAEEAAGDVEAPQVAPKKGWLGSLLGPAAPPELPIAFAPQADEAPELPALAEELAEAAPSAPKKSWFKRLTEGLARSSSAIGRGIVDIFAKRKLDAASLDDLEDILIQADLGVGAATRILEAIGKGRYEKGIDPDEVKSLLADEVERTLTPVAKPLVIDETIKPFVILIVGVNGSGKTTTIGKLAAKFGSEGRRVTLAAGDTFRAAAIAQLKIWADRTGADFVAREQGGDAAGLAFDAVTRAKASGADVLLMDTAGRLQNRAELMSELEKIIRVMKKVDPSAPHATLLVLDATVGQNALSQVEIFGRMAGVTGLVMTKLDGTARGGILVAIADKFKTPVHFIGIGETVDDLEPFSPREFARAIAGLEEE